MGELKNGAGGASGLVGSAFSFSGRARPGSGSAILVGQAGPELNLTDGTAGPLSPSALCYYACA